MHAAIMRANTGIEKAASRAVHLANYFVVYMPNITPSAHDRDAYAKHRKIAGASEGSISNEWVVMRRYLKALSPTETRAPATASKAISKAASEPADNAWWHGQLMAIHKHLAGAYASFAADNPQETQLIAMHSAATAWLLKRITAIKKEADDMSMNGTEQGRTPCGLMIGLGLWSELRARMTPGEGQWGAVEFHRFCWTLRDFRGLPLHLDSTYEDVMGDAHPVRSLIAAIDDAVDNFGPRDVEEYVAGLSGDMLAHWELHAAHKKSTENKIYA